MPTEVLRVGRVDGEDRRGEVLIYRIDLEARLTQLRSNEVSDLAPFILDTHDELEADGTVVEVPDAVHHLRASTFHCGLDEAASEIRIVPDVEVTDQVEHCELVKV